jgi:hypothetical protein
MFKNAQHWHVGQHLQQQEGFTQMFRAQPQQQGLPEEEWMPLID